MLDALRDGWLTGPLVQGGRSAGARVACRTAARRGRPGCSRWPSRCTRRGGRRRAALRSCSCVDVPLLVVQGDTDAFGTPAEIETALTGHGGDGARRAR